MALSEVAAFNTGPIKLGSTNVAIIWGTGAPDGDSSPESDALKGSLYIQTNATDDESPLYLKVDEDSSDDDWVQVWVDKQEDAQSFEAAITMDADNKLYFRDSAIYIYSSGDADLNLVADGHIYIGDGTNQVDIAADGEITLEGTAKVTKAVPLDLITGGGTSSIEAHAGMPSINLDADGETWYFSFEVPKDWDAVSDLTYTAMVVNEIAEDDNDDISFTGQVRGYADGETTSDAGQAVAVALNLTGGDQAQNVVNKVTGTIDYDHGTYPIAAGDLVVCKFTVNLGDGTETTGPLWIVGHWVEYTADKLGTAT